MDVKEALTKATITIGEKVDPTPLPKDSTPSKVEISKSNDLMGAFFKVNPREMTQKTGEKMDLIYEYAKDQAGSDSEFEIVNVLRDLKFRLGAPRGLISNIDNIYKYVRLRGQAKTITSQAKAMEQ